MRINYLMSPNGLNTFTTCVSRITFLSTSSVEPAPRSPLCPGLSTRISDAIVIGLPLIPTSNVCCSTFHMCKFTCVNSHIRVVLHCIPRTYLLSRKSSSLSLFGLRGMAFFIKCGVYSRYSTRFR